MGSNKFGPNLETVFSYNATLTYWAHL